MTTNFALHSNSIREHIHHLISAIIPYDDVEQEHINDTCLWIESGAPLFRIKYPDVPNKHLAVYFILFDEAHKKYSWSIIRKHIDGCQVDGMSTLMKIQKQGIGKILVDVAVRQAKERGFKKLYLFAFDPTIPEYYERLGWKQICMDEFQSHPVTVMEVEL